MAGEGSKKTYFSSTNQPRGKNGRKPSHLRRWLKDNGLGTADVRAILGNIIPNIKSLNDLALLAADDSTPPIVRIPLIAIAKDVKNGKMDSFTWLIRYGYGEPKQEIEQKISENDPIMMSPEDRKQQELELLKTIINENKDLVREMLDSEKEDTNAD